MKQRHCSRTMIVAAMMIATLFLIVPVCWAYVPPGGGGSSGSSSGSYSEGSSKVDYATTTLSGTFTPLGGGWSTTTFKNNPPISMIAIQTDDSSESNQSEISTNITTRSSESSTKLPGEAIEPKVVDKPINYQIETARWSTPKKAAMVFTENPPVEGYKKPDLTKLESSSIYTHKNYGDTETNPEKMTKIEKMLYDAVNDANQKSLRDNKNAGISVDISSTTPPMTQSVDTTVKINDYSSSEVWEKLITLEENLDILVEKANKLTESQNSLATTYTPVRTRSVPREESTVVSTPVIIHQVV